MTRKHFEKLAQKIREMVENNTTDLVEIANAVADVCEEENEKFSRNRFIQACGL